MNKKLGTMSIDDIKYFKEQANKTGGTVNEYKGLVIFLDMLGWKGIQAKNPKAIEKLSALTERLELWILDNVLRWTPSLKNAIIKPRIINLSDTIVIFINDEDNYKPLNIFFKISKLITDLLNEDIALRGAISYGQYKAHEVRNIFIGEAIDDAGEYYESTNWAGVILTDKGLDFFKERCSNWEKYIIDLGFVKYDKIPFKKDKKLAISKYVLLPYQGMKVSFIEGKLENEYKVPYVNFERQYNKIMDKEEVKDKLINTLEFLKSKEAQVCWNKIKKENLEEGERLWRESGRMVEALLSHSSKRGCVNMPTFAKGTFVKIKKEDAENKDWYEVSISGYNTFVPSSFIKKGKLIKDYNPTELKVEALEVLNVLETADAWLLVKNAYGRIGWIPERNTVKVL